MKRLIAGILVAVLLGNQLQFLPVVKAQGPVPSAAERGAPVSEPSNQKELGLIAILADNALLNDKTSYRTEGTSATLTEHIFSYAQNVQNRTPHSLAFVVGVDPNESTLKIASVLEKLYFEGYDSDLLDSNNLNDDRIPEDDNKLIGVVLVGDVPMPVVHEGDGSTQISLYPYTDFYQKRYIYNHFTSHFEANSKVTAPNPDVWHGVIVPPDRDKRGRQELADYFYKNNQYSIGNPEFADFSERMLFANFPAVEKKLNVLDYRNYEHSQIYLEEMAFQRFNKHLLQDLADRLTAELNPDTPPEERTPVMDKAMIGDMKDAATELLLQQYTTTWGAALRTYLGNLNSLIEKTGRYSSNELDTPESLISNRDEYMKNVLLAKSVQLEKKVDEAIMEVSEKLPLPGQVTLQIRACRGEGPCAEGTESEETFNLKGYIHGRALSSVTSADQCGFIRGQQSPEGVPVLENNSVLVQANRIYNPESAIIPADEDDDDPLEDRLLYHQYGKCVGNNSIRFSDPEYGIFLSPDLCDPAKATLPLFDIKGSREISPRAPYNRVSQCDPRFIVYHDSEAIDDLDDPEDYEDDLMEIYGEDAVDIAGIELEYGPFIARVHERLRDAGLLEPYGPDLKAKEAAVISAVLKLGGRYGYSVSEDGEKITLEITAAPVSQLIPGFEKHAEPTDKTILAVKNSQTTPDTPADGIRYVEFMRGGTRQEFDYFNLFRVPGNSPDAVAESLIQLIRQKDQELNQKLGRRANVITRFFLENSDLIEPIVWRNLGIDQKYAMIQHKFMDRDSGMPVLPPAAGLVQTPPVIKPNGYEIWHINAQGDERGFNFGINAAMGPVGAVDQTLSSSVALSASEESPSSPGTGATQEQDYLCGDPTGVEIWEWFDAIQCWIENEILPAHELFSLDNSCSAADVPAPTEEELLSQMKDPFESDADTPAQLNVFMTSRTLMPGEETEILIQPLNGDGNEIFGYIPDPVRLKLDNEDLGTFEQNNFNLFTGQAKVKFIAKELGGSTLRVMLGTMQAAPLDIRVIDQINIKLTAGPPQVQQGRLFYELQAFLVDSTGQRITNVNTQLQLHTVVPLAGVFQNAGIVEIAEGQGKTTFFPSPTQPVIEIKANHAGYFSDTLTLTPPPNPPHHILVRAPRYFEVSESAVLPVEVVDINNNRTPQFNGILTITIAEESKPYITPQSETVSIQNGEGTLTLNPQNQTTQITFSLTHPDLVTATLTRPILARLDSGDLARAYPQNLFASMVGFPAADFFTENYFAGEHLFSGKTQAVFGFLSGPRPPDLIRISPQYKVELLGEGQKVTVLPQGKSLGLYILDQKNLKTVASTTIPLEFGAILPWDEEGSRFGGISPDTLFVELQDSTFNLSWEGNNALIKNPEGDLIARFARDRIELIDFSYELRYNTGSDFPGPELNVVRGPQKIATLRLNFTPRALHVADINVNNDWVTRPLYSGSSSGDPQGLALYDPFGELPEETPGDGFGFEGSNKYITQIAGGTSVGEAVRFNLPPNAVLLGDPTIRLPESNWGPLAYDNTVGEKLEQDPNGVAIQALTHFDFNNDDYFDIAALMKDGRVRLFQGGPTQPLFRDKGDIAFLADGGIAIESFDLEGDGYEDLIISTEEGRLAILNNNREIITRADHALNVGKKLYTLLKGDMDQDGFPDLVTLDSRGDIKIFYNRNNQLFSEVKLIGNYGFSIRADDLSRDLQIRYPGLQEPRRDGATAQTSRPQSAPVLAPSVAQNKALKDFLTKDTSNDINPNAAKAHVQSLLEAARAAKENPIANEPNRLPWPEGDARETYFAQIEEANFLTVKKTVQNNNRSGARNLDLGETLLYTITLTSNRAMNNVVIADTILDVLKLNFDSVTCAGNGCEKFAPRENGVLLFLAPLHLRAGQPVTITYEATAKNTPRANMFIQRLMEPDIADQYLDISVSPPYNNTGLLMHHYSVGPREYRVRASTPLETSKDGAIVQDALSDAASCQAALGALSDFADTHDDESPPESLISRMQTACNLDAAMDAFKKPQDCTPGEAGENFESCANQKLEELAGAINDFACMGGGCFPTPFNWAFMVPPYQVAMPLLAFPATLPTPIGPIPVPSSFLAPTPIGAADIPGPIMSMFRLYLSPTLTGGLGIAMCMGPYTGRALVPPPIFPLPYPPPLGNCIVKALPMGELPVCKLIEDGITKAIQAANSVVSDINAGAAAINGNESVPAEVLQSDEQGAGGLEVSLAVNLGNQSKFEPPVKGFSNIHIPVFDSIGGVLSSWIDRQTLEIANKLFQLPTFSIVLPDTKTLFTVDWERTDKLWEAFINGFNKKTAGGAAAARIDQEGWSLESLAAVENQASLYENPIAKLYEAANAIPFIEFNEQIINFKIPWLSSGQITDFIYDLEQWGSYMERELDRAMDVWGEFVCVDNFETADIASLQQLADETGKTLEEIKNGCQLKQIADMIVLSLDPLLESVDQNVEILKSYLVFPQKVILFKDQFSKYIRDIGCILELYAQTLGGWLATIQSQVVSYAEIWAIILEVYERYKELFDIFINFNTNCEICANERFANPDWFTLLGLVLPDLPIIRFPKWPDVVLDLSKLDGQIAIDLPMVNFVPEPIELPRLPYIRFPDVPDLGLLVQLPALPLLPRLPELPELPELPPVPTLKLPTLPPPPKFPDFDLAFEQIVPLIEKILQIWCLLKKSLAPVPEGALFDQVVRLTNRPMYLIPLDLLKPKLPDIAGLDLGFNELRIETTIFTGMRITAVWDALNKGAEEWNRSITDFAGFFNKLKAEAQRFMEQEVAGQLQSKFDEFENTLDEAARKLEDCIQSGTAKEEDCKAKVFGEEIDSRAQHAINEATEGTLGVVDEIFRDAEERLAEDTMETLQRIIDENSQKLNQKMVDAFDELNQKIRNGTRDAVRSFRESFKAFFDELETYTGFNALEELSDAELEERIQEVLDDVSRQINRGVAVGIFEVGEDVEWTAEQIDEYTQELQKAFDELNEKLEDGARAFRDAMREAEDYYEEKISPQGNVPYQELQDMIARAEKTITQINDNPVDYRTVKEKLGLPDIHLPPHKTTVDKIQWMQEELLTYALKTKEEAERLKENQELIALMNKPLQPIFPNQLASEIDDTENRTQTTTNAMVPDFSWSSSPRTRGNDIVQSLESKAKEAQRMLAQAGGSPTGGGTSPRDGCRGICIVDFNTRQSVEISSMEDSQTAHSVFVPSVGPDQSNLLYSDGDSMYFKRNLDIREPSGINTAPRVPSKLFDLSHFLGGQPVMEAINMMQAGFTEDGASTFEWFEPTNPLRYGYGIELERSIRGFETDEQGNNQPDVQIVLLPPNPDGSTPEVLVNDEPIEYDTLITSLKTPAAAWEKFGLSANSIITDARHITFTTIGGARITLNDNLAVYFDAYTQPNYTLATENGFYHIRMTWFDQLGRNATYNQSELVSPQPYGETAPPIDILFDQEFTQPVFKARDIAASKIFTDLSGNYQYAWDILGNEEEPDQVGKIFRLAPQPEPKEITVELTASKNLLNPSFPKHTKTFKIKVYVPKISLSAEKLQKEKAVQGVMQPLDTSHDLKDIPFSLFRKRGNVWKNLGLLKERMGNPSDEPLGDRNGLADNYYAETPEGDYSIANFTYGPPSPVIIKDNESQIAARVLPGTGQIQLIKPGYRLEAVPASETLPTRVVIVEDSSDLVLSNVYYAAEANTDITIRSEPLNGDNASAIGVTVGDADSGDDIIASNIPGYAPSYPGGVAIFNETPPQENVALVDTDGSIRIMKAGYKLRVKNEGKLDERVIFQIVTGDDDPVFDIAIQTGSASPQIRQDEVWSDLAPTIGFIKKALRPYFASLNPMSFRAQRGISHNIQLAQLSGEIPPSQSEVGMTGEPFSDVNPDNPYFNQILDLYKRRVIEGYGDRTFKPESKISRAEFVKIALGVTNCFSCSNPSEVIRQHFAGQIPFPDVDLIDWFFYCISIAKELGMVTGYGDGFFRPERNISRAEAAAILLRQSGIETVKAPAEGPAQAADDVFRDVPSYAWYKDYVYKAVEIGLIKNNLGFVFPDEEITRGEFAFMAMGLVNIRECRNVDTDQDSLPDSWEAPHNLDPLRSDNAGLDADGDGLTAAEEALLNADPFKSDTDGDGLTDKEEARLGTNPSDPDTDGDGIPDSEDPAPLKDERKEEEEGDEGAEDILPPGSTTLLTDQGEPCRYTGNPNRNDTDADGFIDSCDTDIDGDGISNPADLFTPSGTVDQETIGDSEDNCLFIKNPDQADADADRIGDLCEPTDICSLLPEDLDGIDDLDGCPEVVDNVSDNPPAVYVNRGPLCHFLDYEADFMPGDTIMTAITDTITHDTIFEKSNEVIYEAAPR